MDDFTCTCILRIAPDLPKMVIESDDIKQMLVPIVDNAVYYMKITAQTHSNIQCKINNLQGQKKSTPEETERLQELIVERDQLKRDVHQLMIAIQSTGDYLSINVADTGTGITDQPSSSEGTGLAVKSARSKLKRIGGDLLLANKPIDEGRGAIATIKIPLYKEPE